MSVIKDVKFSTSKHKNFKLHMECFNNASEVADTCSKREITDHCFHDKRTDSYDDWDGVKSYDEALDLLRFGYQPVVDATKMVLRSTLKGEGKRFKFENDVHGFAPIVPLALKGVPNSMIGMKMKPIKAKVIDVYYDAGFSCGVSSDDIIKTGQKMLEVIVGLEKQGYRFNLFVVQGYTEDHDGDMLVVKVKSAEQPVDLKRISFPLAHTGFFRVIGFDWYSKVPNGKYRIGYGKAMSYTLNNDECQEMAQQLFGKNAIYFAGKNILYKDKEYIEEVITNGKCKN